MARARLSLLLGAVCSWIVAAVHGATLVGGAPWYRFFGAPWLAARIERGEAVMPSLLTIGLGLMFLAWGLYALSGAGVLRKLPRARTVLLIIGGLYTLRGLLLVVDLIAVARGTSVPARALFFSAFAAAAGLLHLAGAAPRPPARPLPRGRRRSRRA